MKIKPTVSYSYRGLIFNLYLITEAKNKTWSDYITTKVESILFINSFRFSIFGFGFSYFSQYFI